MEVSNFENTQKEFFNMEISNQIPSTSSKQSLFQGKLNQRIVEEQIKAIFNLKEEVYFMKNNVEGQCEKEISEKKKYEEEVNSIREAEFQIKKVIDIKFKESILQKTMNNSKDDKKEIKINEKEQKTVSSSIQFDEKKELNEVLKVLKDKDSNFLSLNKLKSGPEILIKAFYKTIDCFIRLQKERFFEENYKNQVLFDKLAYCLNQTSIDMKIIRLKEFLSSEIENINKLFHIMLQLIEAYLDGGTFLNSFYLFEKTLISIRFSMVFDFKLFIIKLFIQHFITRNIILQVFIKEINEFSSVFIDYFHLEHVSQFFEIFKEFFIFNTQHDCFPYENLNSDSFYEEKIRKIENNWSPISKKELFQKEENDDGEKIPVLSELVNGYKQYNAFEAYDAYKAYDVYGGDDEDDENNEENNENEKNKEKPIRKDNLIENNLNELLFNPSQNTEIGNKNKTNVNASYLYKQIYDLNIFSDDDDNKFNLNYDFNDDHMQINSKDNDKMSLLSVGGIVKNAVQSIGTYDNQTNHILNNDDGLPNISLLSAYSYLLNKAKNSKLCHDCSSTNCLEAEEDKRNEQENGIFSLINPNLNIKSMDVHQSSIISGVDLKLDVNTISTIGLNKDKDKDKDEENIKEREKQREKDKQQRENQIVNEFIKKEKLSNGAQSQKQAFSSVIGNINQIKSKFPSAATSSSLASTAVDADMSKKDINDLVDFINSTKETGLVKEDGKKGKKRKKKKGNSLAEELIIKRVGSDFGVESNLHINNHDMNNKRKANRVVNMEDEKEIENFRNVIVSCSVHSVFVYKIKPYMDKES